MIDTKILRQIIKSIYNLDDDYIVPISTNWFLPTINPEQKSGTYIGYRILSKKNILSNSPCTNLKKDNIKVCFRLTFIGTDAEQFADQIHFWKDQENVRKIFDSYKLKLNYSDITTFSYPTPSGNNNMAWICDLSVMSDYAEDLKSGSLLP